MPLFQVDVEKQKGGEFWTNVYHIAGVDFADAKAGALAIVSIERGLHYTPVTITKYRIKPFPGNAEGTVFPVGVQGLAGPAGDLLPLFNVARVDFPAPTGRPSRKYYRGCLNEGDQTDGNITDDRREAINNAVAQWAGSGANAVGLEDVDGQILGPGVCAVAVGMRQLRRGSKRKVTPVI